MIISAIHKAINDIRKNYSNSEMSLIDVHNIEEMYQICSIFNTRNDCEAFIRITSFGSGEILFEDIVLNFADLKKDNINFDDLMFHIKKILYKNAYNIDLKEDKCALLKSYKKPSYNIETFDNTIKSLEQKCRELEAKIRKLEKPEEISLFDFNDENESK